MSNKAVCNLPELVGGPFEQVLYLGCSVKNFKINMGWGGETSSCTVDLVRDTSAFPSATNTNTSNSTLSNYQENNSTVFTDTHLDPPQIDAKKTLFRDIKGSPTIVKKTTYTGKKCYNVYYPYNNNNFKRLITADPGFIGDKDTITAWSAKYDIMGIPTIFKWEDIVFGGIIQNWTKKDDFSYSVEINSFAKLLKGVTLILKEYYGSISTFAGGGNYPFNWAFFPSTDYTTVWPDRGAGGANWGGYGNIFNIFGYLESQGFGNSGYGRDKGIPANKVYDSVKEIFTPTDDAQIIFKRNSPFSPSPGVVTRHLFNKNTFARSTASATNYENINLNDLGLLDGNRFYVDFTNVPRPPDGVYINADTMDLISFIDFCCEGAGMDYYIYFDGVVGISTIDRKQFTYRNDLSYYIDSIASSDKVISYNVGEEYSHNQSTKIVIGGNQKRLLQVNSFSIKTPYYKVYEPNTNLFISNHGDRENFRQPNYLNWAGGNAGLYGANDEEKMISAYGYSWSPHSFNNTIPANSDLQQTVKGSYFDSLDSNSSVYLGSNNISPFFGIGKNGYFRSSYYDTKTHQILLKFNWSDIEPFLPGLYDNSYASSTIQSWVKTNIQGQSGFIDYSPLEYGAGDFIVTEYELRAAGAGYDAWWNYTLTRAAFGAPSDLARIIYNYLAKNYDLAFAQAIIYSDLAFDKPRFDYMAYMQVASATYGGRPLSLKPLTYEQYVAYTSGFSNTLKSIHSFLNDLVNTHYGKTYAVRLPNLLTGYDADGGKSNYIITDAAWESQGNMIDDTMFVGSAVLSKLQESDGRIGPLLGFDNSSQYVPYGGPAIDMPTETIGPTKYATQYMMGLRMGFVGGTKYWPLVHNFANDSSVMIPFGTYSYPNAVLASTLQSGASSNFKLYCKASPLTLNPQNKNNPNIVYDGNLPKIILTPPGEISSIADTSPNAIFDEIWAIHKRGMNRPATADTIADQAFDRLPSSYTIPQNLQIYLKFMMWQKSRKGILEDINQENPALINKAPLPTFAAIPIESQYYRYGPWVNIPQGLKNKIITETLSSSQKNNILGNLGGSTEAVIEESLVPWEFGGEYAMTQAAASLASLGNQYQTNIEVGSVTFAGLVLRGVNAGYKLASHPASTIISSISVSADSSNGLTTTYQFRTSSKKLGLFNKELSDTYKSFNQQSYRNTLKAFQNNSRTVVAAGLISTTPNTTLFSRFRAAQLQAFGLNPTVQALTSSAPLIASNNMPSNMVMVANNFVAPDRNNFQGSFQSPDNVSSVSMNGGQSKSYFAIMPDTEAFKVCGPNYDKVSLMSFDGLFSPISLYPTVNNSTFPVTKYTRSQCPYCRGGQLYRHHYVNLNTLSTKNESEIKTTDSDNSSFKSTTEYDVNTCPYCMPDSEKADAIKKYQQRNLVDPPYILVSGSDYIENRIEEYEDNPLVINRYSLSPVILNSGDFGISLAKQEGDNSSHNIDIAGFGHLPPSQGLSARGSLSSNINANINAVDLALKSKNADQKDIQNNVRFIGLRGPLMVHGWGYDVNGYPVPNASGEYKIVAGQVQMHNGKPVYKNQIVQSNGQLTDPYPEHTFAKGWADQPGSWPVGPVDLRWDAESGTWVAPQGYKRVWVTIENDLFNENAVRGKIESMGESTDILPDGYRRVVYVRNPLGTTKAPRYSALYCEYNPDNTQYIPLTTSAVFATGVLLSSSTATIYADYAYIEEGQNPVSYTASFENPLNLNVSIIQGTIKRGVFVFGGENGWILQNVGS